jgi:hypothetical protein
MRIPKLAAECGSDEKYEDVKIMPSDGYVDGEWYAHQGVQVTEWTALENLVTIDAEACNELRSVFHMLGEQYTYEAKDAEVILMVLPEPKPWPFPTGRAPEKQPEPPPPLVWPNGARLYGQPMLSYVGALSYRQAQQASATQPSEPERVEVELRGGGMPPDRRVTINVGCKAIDVAKLGVGGFGRVRYPDSGQKAQDGCAIWTCEPQVRSRSAAAKSPLNGLLTEQSGRYCGLGFCDEE